MSLCSHDRERSSDQTLATGRDQREQTLGHRCNREIGYAQEVLVFIKLQILQFPRLYYVFLWCLNHQRLRPRALGIRPAGTYNCRAPRKPLF